MFPDLLSHIMIEQNYPILLLAYTTGILSTLFIATISFIIFFKRASFLNWSKYLFVFSLVFYLGSILVFQLLKLHTFKYYSDFAVHLELFSNLIDGQGTTSSLMQTTLGYGDIKNYLSIHFLPLLYVFALPLLIIKNYAACLIVLQTLVLTSSVIPIYLFARDVFHDKKIGYLFAASFLFYPTIHYINLYDFEFLRICIPLLLFCFYFLNKKKYLAYYIAFILSILTREEVALTTFFFGIYIAFVIKEKRTGIITSAISGLYFLIVFKIIMPYLAGGSSNLSFHCAFANFSHLGNSPSEILLNIVFHPLKVFSILLSKIKIGNFLMYVLPLLFTPFFSPSTFFISIGNLLFNFLSASISHYSYILYYLSPSIPFIFLSAIKGVRNLGEKEPSFLSKKNILQNKESKKKFTNALVCSIFVASVLSNIFFGPSPLSIQFWNKDYKLAPYKTHNFHYSQYIRTGHHKTAFQFLSLIPDDATVSAEHFFLPYLYKKKTLMQFPIFEGADYVLIDKTHPVKFGTIDVDPIEARKNPQKYYDLVEKDTKNWELIKEEDGIFLFKKRQWN